MIPLSVLDLCPIVQGGDAAQAFGNARDLARHAERLGYRRYWLAEHHNFPGVASAATAVVIGHVADVTSTIRVGAGGIMLPNHAPLMVAEQFGTLAALYPGRIDLGLGRAPGTDQFTARALRRNLDGSVDQFPRDVVEVMRYFQPAEDGQMVHAIPGEGLEVRVWMLGSSLYGAQLAAALGLPYAFASHFAPGQMMEAIRIYRERFEPGAIDQPYVMLGYNVFAADTDEEARYIATSMQQAFVNLRSGRATALAPPMADYESTLGPQEKLLLDQTLSRSAIGSPDTVRRRLREFAERTGADEIIIASQIFDHGARVRSYEIVADVWELAAAC
ncbi:MAG: MsnO8 family LLM class oxidoreductase [Alphaproteobacteria bacterium]|nr:MsnO8 family LLM class oxidoreductase [Alphaproteobacteria bacterium]